MTPSRRDTDVPTTGLRAASRAETPTAELLRLQAEARYASERYRLYKARAYGGRPTSAPRMREFESSCKRAEARLRRAKTIPDNN